MGLDKDEKSRLESHDDTIDVGEVINASGHKQELERQFSLLSICSIGITTGNVWAALGGSIVSSFPSTQHSPLQLHPDANESRSLPFTTAVLQVSSMPSLPSRVSTS